jgi:hypothetical protein
LGYRGSEQSTEICSRKVALREPGTLPASLPPFRSCSTVNHPSREKNLEILSFPPDLGLDFSVLPGSTSHASGKQLKRPIHPLARGLCLELIQQCYLLLATGDQAIDQGAVHTPSSMLLKLFTGSIFYLPLPISASSGHLLGVSRFLNM